MNTGVMKATVLHLYQGEAVGEGMVLSDTVQFTDPLVIVNGRQRVARMFHRLNRLFPHTRLLEFVPLDTPNQYRLCVEYARTPRGRGHVIESVLEIETDGERIVRLVEHWQAPYRHRGDSSSWLSKIFRTTLGWVLT